jgi:hypothetical protein
MDIIEGDILRKGTKFFRVKDFAKQSYDVVCNEILYNPKQERLVIAQDLTYINRSGIGKEYILVEENKKQALEVIKRKYKLMKLDDTLE